MSRDQTIFWDHEKHKNKVWGSNVDKQLVFDFDFL